ncbi:traS protein [Neisseriaceae bacterium ESL0693]|nr:traS protein [Neisseriaceae bacterium ESL0693]
MSLQNRIDDWLLGYKTHAVNQKDSGGFGSPGKSPKSSSKKPLKPGYGLANLRAAALKQPEVMVKITRRQSGNSNGLKGVRGHMDYISRHGKIEVENQDGEILKGKKAIQEQLKDWQKLGIKEESNKREALNIVLSMPAGTPANAVKNAARAFAEDQFLDHQYAFALHSHADNPDEPAHPHVHLCVLMRNQYGQRLNPRKNDLYEWRLRFAEKMREQGIPCAATRRQHRGVTQTENSTIKAMKKRGHLGKVQQRQIKELIEALKTNERPKHLFLKEAMETRGIIVSEYNKISKGLYQAGYKTEAKIISKLAKEVSKAGFDTKAQVQFDQVQSKLQPKQANDLANIPTER